jgi:hypothetical protein
MAPEVRYMHSHSRVFDQNKAGAEMYKFFRDYLESLNELFQLL